MKRRASTPPPSGSVIPFDSFQLRILATSDLHAQLTPYDYTWDRPLNTGGLTRTASLIRTARSEVRNSLLVDNGDFLEGFPFGLPPQDEPSGLGQPVIAAMNRLGYDAVGLGNHEFSYGLDTLEGALRGADFPVVGANTVRRRGATPTKDTPFCAPFHLIRSELTSASGERAPISIGFVSVLPPQVDVWEERHLRGRIETRDMVETLRAWVPHIRALGADLIVALCHSGIEESEAAGRPENAIPSIAAIDGIDVIVAGHTHLIFPATEPDAGASSAGIAGKPVVAAGCWGSHLGVIDLDLTRKKDAAGHAAWAVRSFQAEARPIYRRGENGQADWHAPEDEDLRRFLEPTHQKALLSVRKPIGATDVALHTYFARLSDTAALRLVRDAQRDWAGRTLAGTEWADLPLLVAASPFKSGGRGGPQHFTDIPPGPLERRHVTDLYLYPNMIRVVALPGAALADWLERSAAQFSLIRPGFTDQPLFDPDAPAYNFDTIDGVTYEYDLMAPSRYDGLGNLVDAKASRVRNLCYRGQPVDPAARFVVVTNNFRAAGGGQFPALANAELILEPLTRVSDIVQAHVARGRPVTTAPEGFWSIRPFPAGTAAWFDTGPEAQRHLDEAAGRHLKVLGETPDGFLRCELRY